MVPEQIIKVPERALQSVKNLGTIFELLEKLPAAFLNKEFQMNLSDHKATSLIVIVSVYFKLSEKRID